jgi:hypothetical protein
VEYSQHVVSILEVLCVDTDYDTTSNRTLHTTSQAYSVSLPCHHR